MTTTLAKDTAARSRRSAQSASISDLVSLRQKLLSFVGSGSANNCFLSLVQFLGQTIVQSLWQGAIRIVGVMASE